jgi:hypothetical protein
MYVFGSGGGFIFNPSQNVQVGVSEKNLLAMVSTLKDS